eukprot:361442-Rhodomonas_salina.1
MSVPDIAQLRRSKMGAMLGSPPSGSLSLSLLLRTPAAADGMLSLSLRYTYALQGSLKKTHDT